MSRKKKPTEIEELKAIKRQYTAYKTKDLELLKASYEAREEDNKQVSMIAGVVAMMTSLVATISSGVMKASTDTFPAKLFFLFIWGLVGAVFLGMITTVRNVKTTRTRKIIDIILAERAAAKAKQNAPTSTP
ncbi:hypothetical protein [Paenibacillus polymyxa]|uniref:hypothetical protein n=1 Tax=Paenibacillus polymyxa TaxID=1406 RepID=UPI0021E42EDA|nr:hypothetical protein [Paenibacillus polymyxa]